MSWEDREKEELKLDEGLRLKVYRDDGPWATWTIGYGHTGKDINEHTPDCSEAQADEWLDEDIAIAVRGAEAACPCFDGLDGPRKGALVNMAFQLGGSKLGAFHTFLHLLDVAAYEEASKDLFTTLWAKQVPYRAARIAYRIKTGQYAAR
jgi:lysozyme